MHVDAGSGQFGHRPGDGIQPVAPASREPCELADVQPRVLAETAAYGVVHGHFPESAHQPENNDTDQRVGEKHGRACDGDGVS